MYCKFHLTGFTHIIVYKMYLQHSKRSQTKDRFERIKLYSQSLLVGKTHTVYLSDIS